MAKRLHQPKSPANTGFGHCVPNPTSVFTGMKRARRLRRSSLMKASLPNRRFFSTQPGTWTLAMHTRSSHAAGSTLHACQPYGLGWTYGPILWQTRSGPPDPNQ
eukprot:970544-Pelagomonas_calceolata.AAC.4